MKQAVGVGCGWGHGFIQGLEADFFDSRSVGRHVQESTSAKIAVNRNVRFAPNLRISVFRLDQDVRGMFRIENNERWIRSERSIAAGGHAHRVGYKKTEFVGLQLVALRRFWCLGPVWQGHREQALELR